MFGLAGRGHRIGIDKTLRWTGWVLCLASVGCSEDSPTGSGNEGLALSPIFQGRDIAFPLMGTQIMVQLVDGKGSAQEQPGIAVRWDVVEGGGAVSALAATTDNQGRVLADWSLGPALGEHVAIARVGDEGPARFTVDVVEPGPLVYRSDRDCSGQETKLVISELDGSDRVPIGECGIGWHAEWSPDGTLIAYERDGSPGSQVWVTDPAGVGPVKLTSDSPPDERGLVMESPTWGPQGNRIAFVIKKGAPGCDRSDKNVYTMDPTGGDRLQVTFGCGQGNEAPTWMPDGQTLLFASNRFGMTNLPRRKLFVVATDGSDPVQLTDGTDDANPVLSPDGSRILFTRDGDLWIADADGSGARELHDSDWVAWGTWSPTGDKVLMTDSWEASNGSIPSDVFILDLNTGQLQNVTDSPTSFDCCADWRGN